MGQAVYAYNRRKEFMGRDCTTFGQISREISFRKGKKYIDLGLHMPKTPALQPAFPHARDAKGSLHLCPWHAMPNIEINIPHFVLYKMFSHAKKNR